MSNYISTHILTKRMTSWPAWQNQQFIFQLTSSRRGWRCKQTLKFFFWYFNSHPHEEDDVKIQFFDLAITCISTHILTKRMTVPPFFYPEIFQISTHILTKRMTAIVIPFMRGEDISTHILTKRMTGLQLRSSRRKGFQLTSSRRGWQWKERGKVLNLQFQLTSSRRGWRISSKEACLECHISTHILTKRMTTLIDFVFFALSISTHILTKRMTVACIVFVL